jgi:spermidine synthase
MCRTPRGSQTQDCRRTVEEALFFEIDAELVNVASEHLPEWSDCSDLVGSATRCAQDDCAKILYQDAFA